MNIEKLRTDFAEATTAAEMAVAGHRDGGSANLDFPYLVVHRVRETTVQKAIPEATTTRGVFGGRIFRLPMPIGSDGALRTMQAEAIAKHLEACGWKAGVFYMVD